LPPVFLTGAEQDRAMPSKAKRLRQKSREVPQFAYLPELVEFHNIGRTEMVVSSVLGGRAVCVRLDADSDPLAASLRTAIVDQVARLMETGMHLPYTRPAWNDADVRATDPAAFGELVEVVHRFDDVFARLQGQSGRWADLHYCEADGCGSLFLKDHGHKTHCSTDCQRSANAARRVTAAAYMREYRQTPAVKRRAQ
jgi:hypothetical protein